MTVTSVGRSSPFALLLACISGLGLSGCERSTAAPGFALAGGDASLEVAESEIPAPGDFHQWRGPGRDGQVASASLPQPLNDGLQPAWQVVVGEGHSSPIIGGGRVFLHSRQGGDEVVRSLRLEDGREIWRDGYSVSYSPDMAAVGHGSGPKATPVVASGRLYTYGITGVLSCYRAADGALLWRWQSADDYPEAWPEFGVAASPVIEGDAVMVQVGGRRGGGVRAFDRRDGTTLWAWEGDGPAYSSPIVVTFEEVKQLVTLTQSRLVSLSVVDGSLLWSIPFTTPFDQNVVTPLVVGDSIVFSGLEQGVVRLRPRAEGGRWRAREIWRNEDVSMYMSSPVVVDDRLVGMSSQRRGHLFSLNLETGETEWQSEGRLGEHASLLVADGLIWVLDVSGRLVGLSAESPVITEVFRAQVGAGSTWAHPAIQAGSVLVKDDSTLYRADF